MTTAVVLSQLPTLVDIAFVQGDDFSFALIVTNSDGSAADLSNAVASAQIRSSATSSTIAAEFDCTIAGNVISLHVSGVDTAKLPIVGVWDCEINSGGTTTLAAGKVSVAREVTRV